MSKNIKIIHRNVEVFISGHKEIHLSFLVKEHKRISDMIEKIIKLNKKKVNNDNNNSNRFIFYCENLMKNLHFIKKNKISEIFVDLRQIIKIIIFEKFDSNSKSLNLNDEDKFCLRKNQYTDFKKIINLHKEDFEIHSKEINISIVKFRTQEHLQKSYYHFVHPCFYTFIHYFPNTKLNSLTENDFLIKDKSFSNFIKNYITYLENINIKIEDFSSIPIKLLKIYKAHLKFKLTVFRLNIDIDCFKNDIINSTEDFQNFKSEKLKILKGKIHTKINDQNNNCMKVKELCLKIQPFCFEFFHEFVKGFLNFKKFITCEILNAKFIFSYSNIYYISSFINKFDKFYVVFEEMFDFLRKVNPKYVNLKLIGACFNRSNPLNNNLFENETSRCCLPKQNIISLTIDDTRNEFNDPINIEYFYKMICMNANIKYLSRLTIKRSVIYTPICLVKLAQIILYLNITELSFKHIGIRFEINQISYKAIYYFYICILSKRLTKLVFKNFAILDLQFIQKFSDYLNKNYNITYEFSNSFINREFEFIKFNKLQRFQHLEANSFINYCLITQELDLKNLFSNIKSIKLSNLQLGGKLLINEKSNFFKKLMHISDFYSLEEIIFDNCYMNQINFFEKSEVIQQSLSNLHDREILKTFTEENSRVITYKNKEMNSHFIEKIFKQLKSCTSCSLKKFDQIISNFSLKSLKNLSLTDIKINLDKFYLSESIEKLYLKFSKPLYFYGIYDKHKISLNQVKNLTLCRHAINLNFLSNSPNCLKVANLNIKYLSDSIKKCNLLDYLEKNFPLISKLTILKSDFSEVLVKPTKFLKNLERVSFDFETIYNFITLAKLREKKPFDLKCCINNIQNLVDYYMLASNSMIIGNIYVDDEPINEENLSKFAEKILYINKLTNKTEN